MIPPSTERGIKYIISFEVLQTASKASERRSGVSPKAVKTNNVRSTPSQRNKRG